MIQAAYCRFILSADQRDRVADIVGCDGEALFLQIEEILTDYTGHKEVLDDLPKAADTRDTFAAISEYAKEGKTHMLGNKLGQLHRWAWIEYLLTHINYEDLAELSEQAADMSRRYAGRKSQHRTDQIRHARDFALYDLVDVFREHYSGAIPYEWKEACDDDDSMFQLNESDVCEIFITDMLGFAGIPVPATSDFYKIQKGEQYRGRLRRLIQSYLSSNPSK